MRSCCILLASLIFLSSAQATEYYHDDGMTISLPDGWVQIPQSIVKSREDTLAREFPKTKHQHWGLVFQPKASNTWFSFPRVAVQIFNSGRIPESDLANLKDERIKSADLSRIQNNLTPLITSFLAGKRYYDKTSHIVWMHVNENAARVGAISVITGLILTDTGYIKAMCAFRSDNANTFAPLCQSIISSVTPAQGHAYKSKPADPPPPSVFGVPWVTVLGSAALFGLAALIRSLFSRWRKRPK